MNPFFKNLTQLVGSLVAAYFTAPMFVSLERRFFGGGGSWIDVGGLFGLVLAFIFFLAFLYEAFGARGKYWWMGILLIPPLTFEAYFDFEHIYVPVLVGLVGWALGFGVAKLLGGKASK